MWRFFNNTTRAVRHHWNASIRPTAQNVYNEEENSNESWQDSHHERKTGSTGSGSSSQQHCDQKEFKNGQNRSEKQKTCRNDQRFTLNNQHTGLEAVGWGTAVVLGLQFSQFFNQKDRNGDYEARSSLSRILYTMAFTMPLGTPASLGSSVQRNILPIKETKLQIEDQTQENLQENEDTDASQNETSKESDPFEEACEEWVRLANMHAASQQNQEGVNKFTQGDFREATSLWEYAAANGISKSNYNLGICYETGKGVKQDLEKAAKFYSEAATAGHTKAMYNLAVLYTKNETQLKQNEGVVFDLLEKAANLGLQQAQRELGVLYTEENNKDMEKAVSWFKKAANQKDTESQYYLGLCYENGWGIEQNECKAADFYSKAAKEGHVQAQYSLGSFYEHGMGGLPVDKDSAFDWYQKAMWGGYQAAQSCVQRLEEHAVNQENESQDEDIHLMKPNLVGSHSSPSLVGYIQQRMTQLGFNSDFGNFSSHTKTANISAIQEEKGLRHSHTDNTLCNISPSHNIEKRPSKKSAVEFYIDEDEYEAKNYPKTEVLGGGDGLFRGQGDMSNIQGSLCNLHTYLDEENSMGNNSSIAWVF